MSKSRIDIVDGRAVPSTVNAAVVAFGISSSTFQNWRRSGCPWRPGTTSLCDIHRWYINEGPGAPVEPELAGPPSDELERLRKVKRQLAERDLAERDRELVNVETLRELLTRASARIREANDNLGRRFGPEAQQILNEALDAAGELIERVAGKTRSK